MMLPLSWPVRSISGMRIQAHWMNWQPREGSKSQLLSGLAVESDGGGDDSDRKKARRNKASRTRYPTGEDVGHVTASPQRNGRRRLTLGQ